MTHSTIKDSLTTYCFNIKSQVRIDTDALVSIITKKGITCGRADVAIEDLRRSETLYDVMDFKEELFNKPHFAMMTDDELKEMITDAIKGIKSRQVSIIHKGNQHLFYEMNAITNYLSFLESLVK